MEDQRLLLAIRDLNIEGVTTLLDEGVDVNVKDKSGNTPLHYAVKFKFAEAINLLLDKNVNVNLQNKRGDTPLHCALEYNNIEAVKLILDRNVDVDLQNNSGTTPLHYSLIYKNVEAVKLILGNNCNVNLKDMLGNTPLHSTVILQFDKGVKLLLDKNVNVNDQNKRGNTPLHCATIHRFIEGIELLLDQNVDVNIKNESGNTPLHEAAMLCNLDSFCLLLNHYTSLEAINNCGKTPVKILLTRSSEIAKNIIFAHILKLKTAGLIVLNPEDTESVYKQDLENEFRQELTVLKTTKIWKDICLNIVFTHRLTPSYMCYNDLKNSIAKVILSPLLYGSFPYYADILKATFKKSQKLFMLNTQSVQILNSILYPMLPECVISMVVDRMDDDAKRQLIKYI